MESERVNCNKCNLTFDSLEKLNQHNLLIHMRGFMINTDTGANVMFSLIDHGKFMCPTCFRVCSSFEEIPLHLFCELRDEGIKQKGTTDKVPVALEEKYEFILNDPNVHTETAAVDWVNGNGQLGCCKEDPLDVDAFDADLDVDVDYFEPFDRHEPFEPFEPLSKEEAINLNDNELLYPIHQDLMETHVNYKENRIPANTGLNPNKPFTCSICGKGYATKFYLNDHMRHRHNEKVPKRPYGSREPSDPAKQTKKEKLAGVFEQRIRQLIDEKLGKEPSKAKDKN